MHDARSVGSRGIALVSVLWVLVLLSLIASSLSIASRREGALTSNLVAAAEARQAAEGAVQWALLSLMYPRQYPWLADGSARQVEIGGIPVDIGIMDENGKIDLNSASAELIKGLLMAVDVDEQTADQLSDAIQDWRDADDLRRLNGAEDPDYEAAGREEGAKDAPFERVEELRQVLGMTRKIYAAVKDVVTVHSRRTRINAQVAPALVLLAMPGAELRAVEEYMELRRTNHEEGVPPPPVPDFAQPFVTTSSAGVNYTIYTEARAVRGGVSRLAVSVSRRGGTPDNPIRVLDWKQEHGSTLAAQQP